MLLYIRVFVISLQSESCGKGSLERGTLSCASPFHTAPLGLYPALTCETSEPSPSITCDSLLLKRSRRHDARTCWSMNVTRESLLFSPTRDGVPSSDDSFSAIDLVGAQDALEAEARDVLPFSFNSCTYDLGPIKQHVSVIHACLNDLLTAVFSPALRLPDLSP